MEYLYGADLLEVDIQLIAQQCNCVSRGGKGLSAEIARVFPHADFYAKRTKPSTPGTIEVRGGKDLRWVCAMYAQYHPGPPSVKNGDTSEQRLRWFHECLDKISKIKNLRHIAFPDQIGCGLAKGVWDDYYALLYDFAERHPNIKVTLVSRDLPPMETQNGPIDYTSMTLVEYTRTHLPDGWEEYFIEQLDPEMGSLPEISAFLEREATSEQIFPPLELIYTSFNILKPEEILVVIIGQDPYHNDDQAMGISFSVPKGTYPPPSLKNIYQEMSDSGIEVADPNSGDLTVWCQRGVFLINTALTVRAHTPKSHSKVWTEVFTPALLRWMNERCPPMVIILWGNDAQAMGRHFDDRHRKISSAHPSPLSARGGFFGSNPFNRANKYLRELKRPEVDWSL